MDQLWDILNSDDYYSISSEYAMDQLGVSKDELVEMVAKLGYNKKVQINRFVYSGNGVEYIGLESRRLDYERDKLNGTNRIEKLIEAGFYNRSSGRNENENGSGFGLWNLVYSFPFLLLAALILLGLKLKN